MVSPSGFEWIDVDNALENVVAFMRKSQETGKRTICVGNFSAVPRVGYRLSLPEAGEYKLLINSDDKVYGGSGVNVSSINSEDVAHNGSQYSANIDLPALTTLWFEVPQ